MFSRVLQPAVELGDGGCSNHPIPAGVQTPWAPHSLPMWAGSPDSVLPAHIPDQKAVHMVEPVDLGLASLSSTSCVGRSLPLLSPIVLIYKMGIVVTYLPGLCED